MTVCGNFGIVGMSTGAIHMYNMQSGIRRKSYFVGPSASEATSRVQSMGKERAISGLATDTLNRLVIASTGDGTIHVS